jgi:hypothetical protein
MWKKLFLILFLFILYFSLLTSPAPHFFSYSSYVFLQFCLTFTIAILKSSQVHQLQKSKVLLQMHVHTFTYLNTVLFNWAPSAFILLHLFSYFYILSPLLSYFSVLTSLTSLNSSHNLPRPHFFIIWDSRTMPNVVKLPQQRLWTNYLLGLHQEILKWVYKSGNLVVVISLFIKQVDFILEEFSDDGTGA